MRSPRCFCNHCDCVYYEIKKRPATGELFGGCNIKAAYIRQNKEKNKTCSDKTKILSTYNNRKKDSYDR